MVIMKKKYYIYASILLVFLISLVIVFRRVKATSIDITASVANSAEIANDLGITGGDITMGAWWIMDAVPGTNVYYSVVHQGDGGTFVTYWLRYENNGGTTQLSLLRDKSGVAALRADYAVTLSANRWYCLVGRDDGTNLEVWVDNVRQATAATDRNNGSSGVTDGFAPGFGYEANNIPLDGKMSNVFVYNAAISTARTISACARRPADNDPNLTLFWPMNENTGATLVDHAGTAQNGTITTPLWVNEHPYLAY
jgi:hypothetical protein